jgi:hypothetical protein
MAAIRGYHQCRTRMDHDRARGAEKSNKYYHGRREQKKIIEKRKNSQQEIILPEYHPILGHYGGLKF